MHKFILLIIAAIPAFAASELPQNITLSDSLGHPLVHITKIRVIGELPLGRCAMELEVENVSGVPMSNLFINADVEQEVTLKSRHLAEVPPNEHPMYAPTYWTEDVVKEKVSTSFSQDYVYGGSPQPVIQPGATVILKGTVSINGLNDMISKRLITSVKFSRSRSSWESPWEEEAARQAKAAQDAAHAKAQAAEAADHEQLKQSCRAVYLNTIDKLAKDLTVREGMQIDVCRIAELYRP
jgi:hypothetical protein